MDPLKLNTTELARMSTEEIFQVSGGVFPGHTQFYNGWHGNGWIEKGFIIRYPNLLDEMSKRQSAAIMKTFPETNLVVGAAHNGSIIAGFTARHLNLLFAHTHGKGQEIKFHRAYVPTQPFNICLVEDLVFSGTDVADHIKFFNNGGHRPTGVCVWVNRREDNIDGVKVISLFQHPFEIYKQDCPLCAEGVPIKYQNIRE